MNCPLCQQESHVLDSRVSGDGFSIKRRRECQKCSFRFSTVEEVRILGLLVVKKDNTRQPYSREKLQKGLERALEKRDHRKGSIKKLIHQIEKEIQCRRKEEITTQEIGEIVMKHLKKFDKVAYIRFASVYREFQDVADFQQAARDLAGKKKKKVNKKFYD